MCPENTKILALNGSMLGVTIFTNLVLALKIVLLIVTICYTLSKWLGNEKKKIK